MSESETVAGQNIEIQKYPIRGTGFVVTRMVIHGRYPITGVFECRSKKEFVYVVEGEGAVVLNGSKKDLRTSASVFIESGDRFYWVGELVIILPFSPRWCSKRR